MKKIIRPPKGPIHMLKTAGLENFIIFLCMLVYSCVYAYVCVGAHKYENYRINASVIPQIPSTFF